MPGYVHGYSSLESKRLHDQAGSVQSLIHNDAVFPAGSRVLEAGCGVGAQTVTLAALNPLVQFTCIDIAEESLQKARALADRKGLTNTEFRQADIFQLPFPDDRFDHAFVCFVLEHLVQPHRALKSIWRVLKPGGGLQVFEGDHGSCYYHPETPAAQKAWACLIRAQRELGGDALIGRRLYPLLLRAGFERVAVSPRMVYLDQSNPAGMDGFVRKTIVPMVAGVREAAREKGFIEPEEWERGLCDLSAVADDEEGVFCYTFFKAMAEKTRRKKLKRASEAPATQNDPIRLRYFPGFFGGSRSRRR